LVTTYMFLPYGFGAIFLNDILLGNIKSAGMDVKGISVMHAMAIPALGMVAGLLAAFVHYRKSRIYQTNTVDTEDNREASEQPQPSAYRSLVAAVAIGVCFAIQLMYEDSLVLGAMLGFAVFMMLGVMNRDAASDVFGEGIKMMAMVGFIMIAAQGFAAVMTATGEIKPLVEHSMQLFGSNKGMGDPFSPETPAQTQIWEKMLTDIHKEFIKSVKLGRGKRLKDQQYSDVFSGRIYTGSEAKEVGLIDDFGSVYSVARDVVKAPELVNYTPEEDFGKILGRHLSAEMETKVKEKLSKIW